MPFTNGFRNLDDLRRHFLKHRERLGCFTTLKYEELADTFLGGLLGPNVAECINSVGDQMRYDQITHEFGILTPDRFIRTYLILPRSPAHNRLYFCENCKK